VKCIIAGSRGITDYKLVYRAIEACPFSKEITEVFSGTARGVDQLGERWAESKKIPVRRFPADWDTHGKSAGHIRNAQMAIGAAALICLWDGISRGSRGMIEEMDARGKLCFIYYTNGQSAVVKLAQVSKSKSRSKGHEHK
jgi:hypothetical protein